jgi:hypothetical protein
VSSGRQGSSEKCGKEKLKTGLAGKICPAKTGFRGMTGRVNDNNLGRAWIRLTP